jgi:predicted phosphodiesterase
MTEKHHNISHVEILFAPSCAAYDERIIAEILQNQATAAGPGKTLAGRPVTNIITSEEHLVKLRTEYQLPKLQAQRFIEQAVSREQELNVHHPDKTWFLLYQSAANQNDIVTIGNITPLLCPLNQTDRILAQHPGEDLVKFLLRILKQYLRIAARFEISLDLGLSNFGIDANDDLFYLDDDLYAWDTFNFLPEFLAGLIRSQTWLDENKLSRLGVYLREYIIEFFEDSHWATVVAEGLRSAFISPDRITLRESLISALTSGNHFVYKPKPTAPILALLADIHSNAPALEAAINFLENRNISSALVLGDVVGYGPHPSQCIAMLRQQDRFNIIRGNHDHAVVSGRFSGGVSSLAGWALQWTLEQINEQDKYWLDSLPPYLREDNWYAVHGSPKDKTFFNAYVYHMSYSDNLTELQSRNIQLCFHGHTHIPAVYYRKNGVDDLSRDRHIKLSTYQHALICPGSIGQPRNNKPGVELALINLDTNELEFYKLTYDMQPTLTDMKKAHFPVALIDRLEKGQ